ncbi:hypothetical protein LCM27_15920 [Ruegeria marisrubri]|uniref:hypothetical protein n=1 Tax=Ruegeria marisrubri TaxID=1685379 RepID=UPI001CD1F0BB|nr:hypothetical protein [Ruegeria marisrubri]MCA0907886.1 hypothetical protein [Ruegeria marisrubri]
MIEVPDTLCDIQHDLGGTFLEFGQHGFKRDGMEEVHALHMSKPRADGQPVLREDGRVPKGPDIRRPNPARIPQRAEKPHRKPQRVSATLRL